MQSNEIVGSLTLLAESALMESCELPVAPAASNKHLELAHSCDYVRRVSLGELSDMEQRRIGFPWSTYISARFNRELKSFCVRHDLSRV